MNKWLKKEFQTLVPYHSAYKEAGIQLDANENPFNLLTQLPINLSESLLIDSLNRYPDTDSRALKECIAKHYGVEIGQIACGVGSDQLIDCLLRGALEKGDFVASFNPSFSMYPLVTQMNGGTYLPIPLKEDFSYDEEAFLEAIRKNDPKVIFICNPNNPTGTLLELQQIKRILESTKGLVVVDEAYGEFVDFTAISLIGEYDNLVVLRTFSKAYALAGARVGYAIGHLEIIEMIETIKPPYNLSTPSQRIAQYTLSHAEVFKPVIEELKVEREKLREALLVLGYKVYPSAANFLWLETSKKLKVICEKGGVFIRPIRFNNCVYYRLTVGSPVENQTVINLLKEEAYEKCTN